MFGRIAKRAKSIQTVVGGLHLPVELVRLVEQGQWPRSSQEAMAYEDSWASRRGDLNAIFPNERGLWLQPPPFCVVRQRLGSRLVRKRVSAPDFKSKRQQQDDLMGPSIFKRRLLGGYDQYSPSFWEWPCASPSEINFDLAIDIGDFGHGSDSPIILDYQRDRISPCVKYLRWNWVDRQQPPDNHWIEVAPTFAIFAERIGLMTA